MKFYCMSVDAAMPLLPIPDENAPSYSDWMDYYDSKELEEKVEE